jgi:glycosyltransferase involved in cell wall biosynthesis
MRILYIYKEYKNRRKMYGEMMKNLGHSVTYLNVPHKTKKNQVGVEEIKRAKPDLVWLYTPFFLSYKCINKEAMEYIKAKKIPVALYGCWDGNVPYTDQVNKVWSKIDYIFMVHKESAEWMGENGMNAHYIPLGFYPSQYPKISRVKTIDVSFMGNCMGKVPKEKDKRSIYLKGLKDYNIKVYGKAFRKRLNGVPIFDYRGHEEQVNIYSKTKINLDFPFVNSNHPFYYGKYSLKNRLFEIPATGNFLLTVRSPEFLEIFGEDMVGYYDDNLESLRENIDKYLKDKKLRRDMTARACKHVRQKYTYQHAFNKMFRIIES